MHGGRREGAGRKKGSLTRRTREIAELAAANGMTPLEVILKAMVTHFEAGRLDDAAEKAAMAAPYIHPKLAAIEHSGETTVRHDISDQPLTAEEWAERHATTH